MAAHSEASVVMLVLDDAARAAGALDSIRQTSTIDPEVVVIANGTSDAGLAPIADREDIVLVRLAANVGFGRGCNVGARCTSAPHIVLLNDDTLVHAGWLEALLAATREVPDAGAVGSKLLFADGRVQDAGGIVWNDGTTLRIGWGQPDIGELVHARRDVDYCSASSLMVPRAAWTALGGFDERYFPAYYEDVDLCMRMRGAGYSVLVEPASRVEHHESASTSSTWRAFIGGRNRRRFTYRWADDLVHHEAPADAGDARLDAAVAAAVQRAQVRHAHRPGDGNVAE